jgi:hypothetical protein
MILDTILGLAGLGVSIYAIRDNRRQRTQREKAVIAARSVIERAYGTLVSIKPAVDVKVHAAINDSLAAINQERDTLKSL